MRQELIERAGEPILVNFGRRHARQRVLLVDAVGQTQLPARRAQPAEHRPVAAAPVLLVPLVASALGVLWIAPHGYDRQDLDHAQGTRPLH